MLSLLSLVIAFLLPLFGAQTAGRAADTVTVTMTAKKYEFSPSVVTVTKGQHVKLQVTALDTTHGFEIKDYNVDAELKKGVPATVEFDADREGTFPFKCSHFCGLGHSKMKGEIVVTPAAE